MRAFRVNLKEKATLDAVILFSFRCTPPAGFFLERFCKPEYFCLKFFVYFLFQEKVNAAIAHLVERHLAKVEVASSSLVGRSNVWNCLHCYMRRTRRIYAIQAISSSAEQNHEFCSERSDEGRKSFMVSLYSPHSPVSSFPRAKPVVLFGTRNEPQRWKARPIGSAGTVRGERRSGAIAKW